MYERNPNFQMMRLVAGSLGKLNDDLVYVGGCVVGLLVTDEARPAVRSTQDVDLIAEVATVVEYHALCKRLRAAKLTQTLGDSDVSCRWRSENGIIVDVMPTDEKILGYSNRWFLPALQKPLQLQLAEGLKIKLASPPLLVASKLDAFYGRGGGDYRASHDIEDIINLVDGRPELVQEIAEGPQEVRSYLTEEFDDLLAQQAFTSAIPFHFAPDAPNQNRVPIVVERLRKIAGI